MNINNGKTGNVNIPGPLHSTGGDGDGQVGGVVAYAGDVYDETLEKNQKEINQELLNGSADSNVIAVALNDLNEKVEEQEKVTSNALNDLSEKTDNLNKNIEDLERITSSSLNDLDEKVNDLKDNELVVSSSLNDLNIKVEEQEKVTSSSLNDLNDKVDNLNNKVNNSELVTASALADLDEKTDTNEKTVSAALNDLNDNIDSLQETVDELNEKAIKLNEYDEVNVTYPENEEHEGYVLCNLAKDDEKIIQDFADSDFEDSDFADSVRNGNFYIATNIGNDGISEEEFNGYILDEEITNVNDPNDKSIILHCFKLNDYLILETESELTASNNLYSGLGYYNKQRIVTPFRLESDGNLYLMNVGGYNGDQSTTHESQSLQEIIDSNLSLLDSNNNLLINSKSEVESTASDSLIGGIATVGKGEYAFGFGGNAQKAYVSGNASDGYQLQLNVTSTFILTNYIRPLFESIYKDTYLLDANTYEKVAKITAVTPNTDDQKISITLDTDLGTLTNTLYRLENISKNKSFNFGVFGNTGDWSSILGYGSYNTGSYSNLLGTNNYNSKTYSTLIGNQNANAGNYSTLIGYNNKATAGNYPFAIGIENTLNAYGYAIGRENTLNDYGYAIGRKNVINASGYAFGFDNLINTNGTATAFLIGQKLVCENNRAGYYIGQYNKEYISSDPSIANWFAVGWGDQNSPRQNAIEVKNNADTYIYGVGGFTGANSDSASVKPISTVISELQNTITSLQSRITDLETQLSGGNS